ncbi:MAG: hypothetical protein HAW61_02495 [Candidatus Portiera sp.]|nr:hypothetical protein [Portiera sp.]
MTKMTKLILILLGVLCIVIIIGSATTTYTPAPERIQTKAVQEKVFDSYFLCVTTYAATIDKMRELPQFKNAEFISTLTDNSNKYFAYLIRENDDLDKKYYFSCTREKGKTWITYKS